MNFQNILVYVGFYALLYWRVERFWDMIASQATQFWKLCKADGSSPEPQEVRAHMPGSSSRPASNRGVPPIARLAAPTARIPVRPLEAEQSGHIIFLPIDEVAFCFRGGPQRELIQADWVVGVDLALGRIYIRTLRGRIYQAIHRSLTDLARQFGLPLFSIHQSLLVNLNAVHDAYLRSAKPQVGLRVAAAVEYLTVARRRVPTLKARLMGNDSAD